MIFLVRGGHRPVLTDSREVSARRHSLVPECRLPLTNKKVDQA